MNNSNKSKNLLDTLIDQREIFGDELFVENNDLINEIPDKLNSADSSFSKVKESKEFLFLATDEKWDSSNSLTELDSKINQCTKCVLHKNRTSFVFGAGNFHADVLVIGEGPGAEEDKQGLPFVGKAGKLLTDILKAIKFEREEVYITNIVKCRPPENRAPTQEEMNKCIPYLQKQIQLIKPKLILCLGLTAAKGLLGIKESLTSLRGKVFDYNNSIKVMVTFHPAALLRNPHWKRDCWKDVQEFRKLYDEIIN
jgi:DNA polymerase